jgi:LmbE family N-acetylglucosaminyl deacetylase
MAAGAEARAETAAAGAAADDEQRRRRARRLDEAAEALARLGVRVVAFDMDQTAVAMHSRGCLPRDPRALGEYLDRATPDFVDLVPLLRRSGIGVCIATHSDEAEYGGLIRPSTHILGSELASALLDRCFDPKVAQSVLVVAYNPRARGREGALEENRVKRYYVRQIRSHFGVSAAASDQILLLDDLKEVVDDCRSYCGIRAVQVDPRTGFRLQDVLEYEFC